MEKKLWSNAELVELGVESTKNNEADEAWLFWCDVKDCHEVRAEGSRYCLAHTPEDDMTTDYPVPTFS